ncbi:hypothetical protein GCM10025868_11360 [Angustibacter aerolatus]|uniref:Uncharacterized protein n=1 Tax=Angustibacter aerolatus TaxID=1162965 RepID=A0ABQ6JCH5_9ACTN|nr:hypothetical protein GCM10025868_11360 [Angustibacter aerolatus]
MQMTPTCPVRLAAAARRTAGRITSTTGTSYRSRASASTAALALLQAITSSLHALRHQPVETLQRVPPHLRHRPRPVRLPRGVTQVQHGLVRRWSSTARATVRPPYPESKMPMGASATTSSLSRSRPPQRHRPA